MPKQRVRAGAALGSQRKLGAMRRCFLHLLSLLSLSLLGPHSFAQEARVSQESINDAVDRGVAWMLQQQRRDGSWGENDLTPGGHRDPRSDLTAFCTYTLLKCKVPYEHAAIQRALTYLEADWPWTTYAVANQILLLTACADERWNDRIDELVERLIDLRFEAHGTWGYPKHPSIESDLSNTQYAALALRAASAAQVQKTLLRPFAGLRGYAAGMWTPLRSSCTFGAVTLHAAVQVHLWAWAAFSRSTSMGREEPIALVGRSRSAPRLAHRC